MLQEQFDSNVAEKVKHRLADLRAASSVSDVVLGSLKEIANTQGEKLSIDLCDGYQIIFQANHIELPLSADGKVDWSVVTRIKVLNIKKESG